MAAVSLSTACFLLWAAIIATTTTAAPTPVAEGDLSQSQALDFHNETDASRCYYNFQHYEEGDRIVTNEPCLNCTCHKRMLMCYLRVCPFTKAVGQDCTVEKRPDQCCPVITCPQVPVDILTSSTTTEASKSTEVGHLSNYGCKLEDNTFYPDGVQMPSDSKKPCELCYCIRNQTACVRQECTLNVEGCQPIYQDGVCCPVRYDCDYNQIGTTERPSSGGLMLGTTVSPSLQCHFGDTLYNDGELMVTDKPCESCYCMRGDIVCAVRSCGEPMEGKDCEPLPPPEGECCPTTYQCANGTVPTEALELVTQSSIVMHSSDDKQTEDPSSDSKPQIEEGTVENESAPSAPEQQNEEHGEDGKEPLKAVEDKVDVQEPEDQVEHVESDPIDTEEHDDGSELPEANPSSPAELDHSGLVTDTPSDVSEHISTSAPDSVAQDNIALEEVSSGDPAHTPTESDQKESEALPTEAEGKPDIESMINKDNSESSTTKEADNVVADGNESVPKLQDSAHDNSENGQETISDPTDTEITTEIKPDSEKDQEHTDEILIKNQNDNEATVPVNLEGNPTESSNQEISPEEQNDKVNVPKNPEVVKESESSVDEGTHEGHSSDGPENDENGSDSDSVPVASDNKEADLQESSTGPSGIKPDENNADLSVVEATTNESMSEPQVENDDSENSIVFEGTVSKSPESPESLDQIKETEASSEIDINKDSNTDGTENTKHTAIPTPDASQENIHDHIDTEIKPDDSEMPKETENEQEISGISEESTKPLENNNLPKEPNPPRKDDAVPTEPDQQPQHAEGSMTKAEDAITDEATQSPYDETEHPVKQEESNEDISATEIPDEQNIKPSGESNSDITNDQIKNSDLPEEENDAVLPHVAQTDKPESDLPSSTLLPQAVHSESSEKADEVVEDVKDHSETSTEDQSVIAASNDEVEDEVTTDKTKPQDSIQAEVENTNISEEDNKPSEEVFNVVITESEPQTATDSVHDDSNHDETFTVAPESDKEGSTPEQAEDALTSHNLDSSASPSKEPTEEQSELKPSADEQESHDALPEDEVPESFTKPSNSSPLEEEAAEEGSNIVSSDDKPLEGESSTKENEVISEDIVPTKTQSEANELSHNAEDKPTNNIIEDDVQHNSGLNYNKEADSLENNNVNEDNIATTEVTGVPSHEQPDGSPGQPTEGSTTDVSDNENNKESVSESKPVESGNEEEKISSENKPESSSDHLPSQELENTPNEENIGTNDFPEVPHDSVESDPTDIEDEELGVHDDVEHESPSENEIEDQHLSQGGSLENKPDVAMPGPVGVIPGEGDCLVDGQTYTNNSRIPSKSPCHKECTCLSSIVHCQGIDCPPPPAELANCMPVHQGDLCCPVYTCDGESPASPESHNQMGATEEATEDHTSTPLDTLHQSEEVSTASSSSPAEESEPTGEILKPSQIEGETEEDNQQSITYEDENQSPSTSADPVKTSSTDENVPSNPEVDTPVESPQENGETIQIGGVDASQPEVSNDQLEDQYVDNKHSDVPTQEETTGENYTVHPEVKPQQPLEEVLDSEPAPNETDAAEKDTENIKPESNVEITLDSNHSDKEGEQQPIIISDGVETHEPEPEGTVPPTDLPTVQDETSSQSEESNVLEPESSSSTNAVDIPEKEKNQEVQTTADEEKQNSEVTNDTIPEHTNVEHDSQDLETESPTAENVDVSNSQESLTSDYVTPEIDAAEEVTGVAPSINHDDHGLIDEVSQTNVEHENPASAPLDSDVKPTETPTSDKEEAGPVDEVSESTSSLGDKVEQEVELDQTHNSEVAHSNENITEHPTELADSFSTNKPQEVEISPQINVDEVSGEPTLENEEPSPSVPSLPPSSDSTDDEKMENVVTEISSSPELSLSTDEESTDNEISHEVSADGVDKEIEQVTEVTEVVNENKITESDTTEPSEILGNGEQTPQNIDNEGEGHETDSADIEKDHPPQLSDVQEENESNVPLTSNTEEQGTGEIHSEVVHDGSEEDPANPTLEVSHDDSSENEQNTEIHGEESKVPDSTEESVPTEGHSENAGSPESDDLTSEEQEPQSAIEENSSESTSSSSENSSKNDEVSQPIPDFEENSPEQNPTSQDAVQPVPESENVDEVSNESNVETDSASPADLPAEVEHDKTEEHIHESESPNNGLASPTDLPAEVEHDETEEHIHESESPNNGLASPTDLPAEVEHDETEEHIHESESPNNELASPTDLPAVLEHNETEEHIHESDSHNNGLASPTDLPSEVEHDETEEHIHESESPNNELASPTDLPAVLEHNETEEHIHESDSHNNGLASPTDLPAEVEHDETEEHIHESESPSNGLASPTDLPAEVEHDETEEHIHESESPNNGLASPTDLSAEVEHDETEEHIHESESPNNGLASPTDLPAEVEHDETEEHIHESESPNNELASPTDLPAEVEHDETEEHIHESESPNNGLASPTDLPAEVEQNETEEHIHESESPNNGLDHTHEEPIGTKPENTLETTAEGEDVAIVDEISESEISTEESPSHVEDPVQEGVSPHEHEGDGAIESNEQSTEEGLPSHEEGILVPEQGLPSDGGEEANVQETILQEGSSLGEDNESTVVTQQPAYDSEHISHGDETPAQESELPTDHSEQEHEHSNPETEQPAESPEQTEQEPQQPNQDITIDGHSHHSEEEPEHPQETDDKPVHEDVLPADHSEPELHQQEIDQTIPSDVQSEHSTQEADHKVNLPESDKEPEHEAESEKTEQKPEQSSEEIEQTMHDIDHHTDHSHTHSQSEDTDSKPDHSKPVDSDIPTEDQFPSGGDLDYDVGEDGAFGPGTCRYGGKVYVSAQQIPRDDPCDFCFCFRSDIICLQQSCPPPIHRCHQEPIQGYCCPRYQCPVSMATSLNVTTTTTTTTTTLPPHFFAHAYLGAARQAGCLHKGRAYSVGEEITTASGPCLQCICGSDGQMKCDPVVCSPEPMLRKMMEAAVSHRRR